MVFQQELKPPQLLCSAALSQALSPAFILLLVPQTHFFLPLPPKGQVTPSLHVSLVPFLGVSRLPGVHHLQSSPAQMTRYSPALSDAASHLQLLSVSVYLSPPLPSLPNGLKGKGNYLFSPVEQAKHLYVGLYATQKSSLA